MPAGEGLIESVAAAWKAKEESEARLAAEALGLKAETLELRASLAAGMAEEGAACMALEKLLETMAALEAAVAELAGQERTSEGLREQLAAARAEIARLSTSCEDMKLRGAELERRGETLALEKEELKGRLEDVERELEEIGISSREEISKLYLELDRLRLENRDLGLNRMSKVNEESDAKKKLRQELQQTKKSLEKLQTDIIQLRKKSIQKGDI